MKILLVVLVAATLHAEPKNSFRYVNADIHRVLEGYRAIVGVEMVIASGVTNVLAKITVEGNSPTPSEAQRLLDHALLDQAGIVVTPLKEGRLSVTYNDALHREANIRAVRPSNAK